MSIVLREKKGKEEPLSGVSHFVLVLVISIFCSVSFMFAYSHVTQNSNGNVKIKEREWTEERSSWQARVSSLEVQLNQEASSHMQIHKTLESTESRFEAALEALKEDVSSKLSQHELAVMKDRQVKSDEEVEALQDRLAKSNSEVAALQDRLAKANGEVGALQDRLVKSNGEVVALQDRMAKSNGEVATLLDRLAKSNGEVAALQDKVANSDSEVAALQDRPVKSDGDVTILLEWLVKSDSEVATLKDRLVKSNDEVAALQDKMIKSDGDVAALQERLFKWVEQIDRQDVEPETLLTWDEDSEEGDIEKFAKGRDVLESKLVELVKQDLEASRLERLERGGGFHRAEETWKTSTAKLDAKLDAMVDTVVTNVNSTKSSGILKKVKLSGQAALAEMRNAGKRFKQLSSETVKAASLRLGSLFQEGKFRSWLAGWVPSPDHRSSLELKR